jgi:glycosyltransferase involved in cell wall biosynthesis
MKIIIISQVFWPDESAGSQILTDLAEALIENGFEVDLITSGNAYENKNTLYPKEENYKGIHIKRLRTSWFGKGSKLGRFITFFTFNVKLFISLLFIRKGRYELMISLSVPPLISFFGIIVARLKKIKFLFWAMDLQPELAILSGYLNKNSYLTKMLLLMGDYAYKKSDLIVTLDKYMAEHIKKRGAKDVRIKVIPVWPVMYDIFKGNRLDNPFRIEHGFADKVVIMYSGNHSVMHSLYTLLNVALDLRDDPRFLFVFVGGGVRKRDVTNFIEKHLLTNIVQLPLQGRDKIHLSLSSADIHAVVLGNGCTGYTHPSKIYSAMAIGRPVLYVGPKQSYVIDMLNICLGNISVEHNQKELLAKELRSFACMSTHQWDKIGSKNTNYIKEHFSKEKLMSQFISHINFLLNQNPEQVLYQ